MHDRDSYNNDTYNSTTPALSWLATSSDYLTDCLYPVQK